MSLNVIGLISGGKDSLFCLAHCIQNGHKVVALANLCPHKEASQNDLQEGVDLDSFMYQTVGHTIIPLYSEALCLPLYRRATIGRAIQTGKDYSTTEALGNHNSAALNQSEASGGMMQDETEDMYLLLQEVVRQHPEANAVSAGAILSTYQRTRVESVAVRLGLIPLAYLWQYPALPAPNGWEDTLTSLLDHMYSAGCDARIIKIASGGIRSDLLFANVADTTTRSRLVSGLSQFHLDPGQESALRGAVLGEGGEYETLALDGPGILWKRRIEVVCTGSHDAEGGISYAHFGISKIVDKVENHDNDIPIPTQLDLRFVAIFGDLLKDSDSTQLSSGQKQPSLHTSNSPIYPQNPSFIMTLTSIQVSNLVSHQPGDAATQFLNIVSTLSDRLQTMASTSELSPTLKAVLQQYLGKSRALIRRTISTTLLLRSIDSFASVNNIYNSQLWPQGLPNPPARVTIAAPLPDGVEVVLSLIIDLRDDPRESKGLHVQSRSYWAPANIGPYSQAISSSITCGNLLTPVEAVHMAGQIPLIPASMELADGTFAYQAVLALQHLWRVGQERGVDFWVGAGVAYLPQGEAAETIRKAREAARIWHLGHSVDEKGINCSQLTPDAHHDDNEDGEMDIWHLQHNHGFLASSSEMTIGNHLHVLPNYDIFEQTPMSTYETQHSTSPTFIAAEVTDLPRHALIEWWSTGLAGLASRAGREHCKTFTVSKKEEHKAWTVHGVLIEYHNLKDSATTDGHGGEASSNSEAESDTSIDGMTAFITLTIGADAKLDTVPKTQEEILNVLSSSSGSSITTVSSQWRYDVVTAHSLMSLSSNPETRKALETVPILQQANLVPCYHVWASTDPDDEECVQEVAVAVIMRIDTFRV